MYYVHYFGMKTIYYQGVQSCKEFLLKGMEVYLPAYHFNKACFMLFQFDKPQDQETPNYPLVAF